MTSPKTVDLDAIEARAAAATPGPWTHSRGMGRQPDDAGADWLNTPAYSAMVDELETPDAAFIAHARVDVPAMAREIRELRAELTRCQTLLAARVNELEGKGADLEKAQAEAVALRGAVVEIANAHPDGNPFRLIELARAALAKVQP